MKPPERPLTTDERFNRRPPIVQLLDFVSNYIPFRDAAGGAYLSFPVGDEGWRAAPARSPFVRSVMIEQFCKIHHHPPSVGALRMALRTVESHALTGPVRSVELRLARKSDDLVSLDLQNAEGQSVEITSSGWEVTIDRHSPYRPGYGATELPAPEPGGALEALRPLLNLASEQDWTRIQAWLVCALKPHGPYPILVLEGPSGTGKTTVARILRALLDPNKVATRALPANEKDLMDAAYGQHLLVFDHVTKISRRMADALCRLSEGTGHYHKEHNSGLPPLPMTLARPIVLIMNTPPKDRALRQRTLTVQLPPIESIRSSDRLLADLNAAAGAILGALCDAVSTALRRSPGIRIAELPRLADAAIWTVAAFEHADPETILEAFTPWRSLDPDPLEPHLESFLAGNPAWQGPATHLLAALQSAGVPNLPQTPKGLSQRLNQMDPTVVEPLLLRLKNGERRIRLTKSKDASKPPAAASKPKVAQALPPVHPPREQRDILIPGVQNGATTFSDGFSGDRRRRARPPRDG